jgi:hypothetical protein
LGKVVTALVILLTVILSPILIILLALLTILMMIMNLPRKVGEKLNFEQSIRKVVYRIVDPEKMRWLRDDMLHIMESELEIEEDLDRWGLLREIDKSQEEIEKQLRDGESAFSLIGTISALIIGSMFSIELGGIILTLVVLIFSFLVSIRIIITDTLCYQSVNHRNDPLHRLVLLKGWNRGPIFKSGVIWTAVLSVIATKSDYRLGRGVLRRYAEMKYDDEDKWRAKS